MADPFVLYLCIYVFAYLIIYSHRTNGRCAPKAEVAINIQLDSTIERSKPYKPYIQYK